MARLVYHFVFGWWLYPARVGPQVTVNWPGTITAALCLLLLAVGLHRFLRWLAAGLSSGAVAWKFRWTAGILALVVVTFAAGICVVGITHQAAWLLTDPHPLIQQERLSVADDDESPDGRRTDAPKP
jgi:hypothetical protein